MHFVSRSPEDTLRAGRTLAQAQGADGIVVGLVGPLGAGKTVFVKGLAAGLGIDPGQVASPTFTIASEYRAPDGARLAHVDCYRLRRPEELLSAGFLDWLEPGAWVVIEWAERVSELLPEERLELRIARGRAGSASRERVLHAEASGALPRAACARWRAALGTVCAGATGDAGRAPDAGGSDP